VLVLIEQRKEEGFRESNLWIKQAPLLISSSPAVVKEIYLFINRTGLGRVKIIKRETKGLARTVGFTAS